MVSLRRRRLLGLCYGPNGYVTPLPILTVEGMMNGISSQNNKVAQGNPMSVDADNQPKEEKTLTNIESSSLSEKTPMKVVSSSPSNSGSISPKEQQIQFIADQPIKRRKRHRRKQVQNQELCLMRGVYFKNMKWQAAIKVDKKQIHLGTVASQEEAARLYDRAAFMCGREPNFELSEAEKQELRKFSWDEFLAFTRRAITNKKSKRRIGSAPDGSSELLAQNDEWDGKHGLDNNLSGSEEMRSDSPSS